MGTYILTNFNYRECPPLHLEKVIQMLVNERVNFNVKFNAPMVYVEVTTKPEHYLALLRVVSVIE